MSPDSDLAEYTLVKLHDDGHTAIEVARTISLAFSADPLVGYCRPGAEPWGLLGSRSMSWQTKRVKVAMLSGIVVSLARKDGSTIDKHSHGVRGYTPSKVESGQSDPGLGAVAIFYPPGSSVQRSWMQLSTLWIMRAVDYLWSDNDGANMKRMAQLESKHTESIQKAETLVGSQQIWYIEVVAVSPELQGLRLGGELIEKIKADVKGDAAVLESTSSASMRFYQKHGFEVVAEPVLEDIDTGDRVQYWTMLWMDR